MSNYNLKNVTINGGSVVNGDVEKIEISFPFIEFDKISDDIQRIKDALNEKSTKHQNLLSILENLEKAVLDKNQSMTYQIIHKSKELLKDLAISCGGSYLANLIK